jgi:2-oxoglutarate dehydrogenase E2 component (dihydrolipoamide succinyltransferase)
VQRSESKEQILMAVGSLVDVVMPQMGVSVSEGTISRWAKQVGDRIEADETIVEISTDKVDTEVPSPASGTVVALLVPEGETVPVGTAIARIDTGGGEAPAAAPAPDAPAAAVEPPAPVAPPAPAAAEPPPHFGPATTDGGYTPPTVDTAPASASAPAPIPVAAAPAPNGGGDVSMRTFMSPVVARMVAEHGLDVAALAGTGNGGRVTKRDVEVYLAGGAAPAVPAAPAAPAAPAVPVAAAPAVVAPTPPPAAPVVAAAPAPAAPAPAPAAGDEVYAFSTIRKAIAKHMLESKLTTAQLTSVTEVDMTAIAGYRKTLKDDFARRHGVNLTFLPFIMKAAVDAIGKWPWVNAEIRGEQAVIKRSVNFGMAVAVDDGKGLLVPVIKNAESLSMVGLARSLADLADRARKKQLTADEMSGATFSITNPGGYGSLIGTPILPLGTTAIIGVMAIVKRPVVITDEQGNDAIGIRQMMFLPMTYDHRLVDGAYAAQFMRDLRRNLETWPIDAYLG